MNFCLVITNLSGGGAERATIDLAKALTQANHHVELILLENQISYEIPGDIGINIIQKEPPFLDGFIGKKVLAYKLKKKWAALNSKFIFDATISRLPFCNEIVSGLNLSSSLFIIDNALSEEIKKLYKSKPFKAIRKEFRYKRIYKNKNLIAVSKGLESDLIKFLKHPALLVHQIYNPVDFESIVKKSRDKQAAKIKSKYILNIARSSDQKRHDLLLDAFKILKTDHKLVLISDNIEKITKLVQVRGLEKRVLLLPFTQNPYAILKRSELLVLSSDFEGFGLVLLESLICGTPVVSTNCNFGPEEILGKNHPNLIPVGSAYLLAKKIDEVLKKPKRIITQDLTRFTFKTIAQQYEKIVPTKSALFIKTKNIGDSIILTSAIEAMPDIYRNIDVICRPDSADIFKMSPRVRNVFTTQRNLYGFKKLISYYKFYSAILKNEYQFISQFSTDIRGGFLAMILKADISVTRKNLRRGLWWHSIFTHIELENKDNYPVAERDIDLLRASNHFFGKSAPAYYLKPPQGSIDKIKKFLRKNKVSSNDKLIIIHAPSRWQFKEIQISTWANAIEKLNHLNFKVVLDGSESDYEYNKKIYDLCNTKPIIARNNSLLDAAALLNEASLIISIDTMAVHLASALKKKIITIFGPTNEKDWGPWRTVFKVIAVTEKNSPRFKCRPCGQDGCEGTKKSDCLDYITPKMILDKVNSILRI